MKTTTITKVIELPHTDNLTAVLTIERAGQNPPAKDDDVSARGSIALPCNPTSIEMHKKLQFSNRVSVLGENLGSLWGDGGQKYRRTERNFSATTWASAFRQAEVCLEGELQKLIDALEARHQALINAEK